MVAKHGTKKVKLKGREDAEIKIRVVNVREDKKVIEFRHIETRTVTPSRSVVFLHGKHARSAGQAAICGDNNNSRRRARRVRAHVRKTFVRENACARSVFPIFSRVNRDAFRSEIVSARVCEPRTRSVSRTKTKTPNVTEK